MQRESVHRGIYILSLTGIVVGLPISRVLISTGIILLAINWIAENNFAKKWQLVKSNKNYLLVLSIYLIHLIWAFNTSNFEWYLRDIKIKLPLLAIPLIIASTKSLSKLELKIILLFFIAAVTTSSFFSIERLFSWEDVQHDHRYLSVFIYHIRFAVEIILAIVCLVWLILDELPRKKLISLSIYCVVALWLIVFLFILQSLTAIVLLIVTGGYLVVRLLIHVKNNYVIFTVGLLLLLFTIYSIQYVLTTKKLLDPPEVDLKALPKNTLNGNPYTHEKNSTEVENNHFTKHYLCYKELYNEWNKRSTIPANALDNKHQQINQTLIRYLTSKGLPKDSVGVWQLNDRDIALIEQGIANYKFDERIGLFKRTYKFFWELHEYKTTGNPNAHTILQRIEYTKTALYIIKQHFWLGTGTGDYKDAYEMAYAETNTPLAPKYQLRAHNQLLTFILMFGIVGGLWVIYAFLFPFFNHNSYTPLLTNAFLIISFLSFFNEDTLETHVGVSIIAVFYSLFIFGTRKSDD